MSTPKSTLTEEQKKAKGDELLFRLFKTRPLPIVQEEPPKMPPEPEGAEGS
jgi:hypothetical protein